MTEAIEQADFTAEDLAVADAVWDALFGGDAAVPGKNDPADEPIDDAETKAAPASPVPDADALLAQALDDLDLAAAFADATITPEQRLDVLHQLRIVCRAWMRQNAEVLMAVLAPDAAQEPGAGDEVEVEVETKGFTGDAAKAVKAFFGSSKKFLRNMLTAGALVVFGPEELTPAMLEGIDENVAVQEAFLEGFEKAMKDGTQPLDGTVAARAELYPGSVWTGTHKIMRKVAKKTFQLEKRIHIGPRTASDPCTPCSEQEAMGWQPIGTLLSIGESTPCGGQCHCTFRYRIDKNDQTEYLAGRGPLSMRAFGRTG